VTETSARHPSTQKPGQDQSESPFVLAVDIGGSKIAIGKINTQGQLLGQMEIRRVPFDQAGVADPEEILRILKPFADEAKATRGFVPTIGLSVCGNIDMMSGEAVLVANLHWRNVPFGAMVRSHLGLGVSPATDVRMAALAEATWGAGRGAKHFAWVTVGTGYGAYLFLEGKLYGGAHDFAGNFGHNTLDEINGFPCGCGRRGCVETFVSGPAIARAGQKALDEGRSPALRGLAPNGKVTCEMVFQAEAAGDPAAHEILDSVIRLIAISIASLVNTLDLELVVLGGGVMRSTPSFLQRIEARTRDYLMTVEARRDLRIAGETFPNSALFGAAAGVFLQHGLLPS